MMNKEAGIGAPQIPDDAFADISDGTLKLTAWNEGLTITQAGWNNVYPPGFTDTVQCQVWLGADPQPGLHDRWLSSGPPVIVNNLTAFPLPVKVPPDLLNTEGEMAVRVFISRWNDAEDASDFTQFRTDRTAPYNPGEPAPAEVTPAVITDSTFDNGGEVTVKLLRYSDFKEGDKAYIYWVPADADIDWSKFPAIVENQRIPSSGDIEYKLPGDSIRANGSKPVMVSYVLVDKAGNRSNFAEPTVVHVALGPLASGMTPLAIPQAQERPDDVLLLADAVVGVYAEILPFQNAMQGDVIKLYWGSQPAHEFVPSIWPFPASPLQVAVPNTLMLAEYGANTKAVETDVAYEVVRGGVVMGSRQTTTIKVNFFLEGPEDPVPGWPDPINEALNAVTLVPSDPDGADNELTPADRGQPATLKVLLDDGIVVGQVLRFFLGDMFVVEHAVAADEPGTEVAIDVPWVKLEERNNGAWALYYQLVSPASGNYWQSVNQPVKLGAVALPVLAFPNLSVPGNFLNCDSLKDATSDDESGVPIRGKVIHITVPDVSHYVQLGGFLTLKWVPMLDFIGDKQASGTYQRNITLNADMPPTGFIWEIPYDPYVLCIYNEGQSEASPTSWGRGRVHAEFDAFGISWVTDTTEALIAAVDGAGACPI